MRGLAATIDALTEDRSAQTEASPWRMTELAKGSVDAPVLVTLNQPFLFHTLARKLTARTVALHLEAREALDRPDALDTWAAQAAQMITKTAGPRPILLIGHCVDGLFARAIADHMERAPILVMVDSWVPGAFDGASPLVRKARRWITRARRWQQLIAQKYRGQLSWDELWSKNSFLARRLVAMGRIEPVTEEETREIDINHRLVALMKSRRFDPYGGEAILFQTGGQRRDARPRLFGWKGLLAPDTPLYDLPGWHESAFQREGADVLAAILNARLARL